MNPLWHSVHNIFDSHSAFKVSAMSMENIPPGGVPIVKIDGLRVRRLREEKGLTQLYVSTVVGVTTDTISRWENRRYPTIKKENALKLAEALEAGLEEILEQETLPSHDQVPEQPLETPPPPSPPDSDKAVPPAAPRKSPKNMLWFALAGSLVLIFLAVLFSWWRLSEVPVDISVSRSLPRHVPPGQPFPVVITITINSDKPYPLIVKESLPPECRPVKGLPEFTAINAEDGQLKWISTLAENPTVFSYIVTSRRNAEIGRQLVFDGQVTMRQGDTRGIATGGDTGLSLEPYHWADSNKDGRIDDEEILTVSERYGAIESLDFDMELIEDIWSAKGYNWDGKTGRYIITP